MTQLTFEDWLAIGVKNSWVGAPVCTTHDGLPITDEESQQFDDGDDPCIYVLRCYESDEQRQQIETDHSPSQWRRTNRGL